MCPGDRMVLLVFHLVGWLWDVEDLNLVPLELAVP